MGKCLALAAMALSLFALACSSEQPAAEPMPLLAGWHQGQEAPYYDLGSNSPASGDTVDTAPVWVLVYGVNEDGTLDKVPGQKSIFNVNVGDPGYSDLWQVTLVTVPRDYEPDSIRSVAEIEASGYPTEAIGMFVNCPFVPQETVPSGGEELVRGWVDGETVYYLDFGPSSANVEPVWVLWQPESTSAEQHVIFRSVDDNDVATPFRRVHLVTSPDGQDVTSIRSVEDLMSAGLDVAATDTVVNQPVVEPAAAAPPASQPDEAYVSDSAGLLLGIVLGVIALGAFASAGALFIARRSSN